MTFTIYYGYEEDRAIRQFECEIDMNEVTEENGQE